MTTFLLYSLKAAGCLVAFFLFYKLLLSRDTLHRLNRILLDGVLLLSFVLPVCVVTIEKELPYVPPVEDAIPVPEFDLTVIDETIPVVFESDDEPVEEPFDWLALGAVVYVLGACVMLCWTLWGIFSVVRLIRRGRQIPLDDGVRLVLIEKSIVPFSWMRYIVISEADYARYGRTILLHERAHLRLGHSWDLLWIDLLGCLQWFNPAMWLLRRELRAVHEFEADEAVLRAGVNAREYQLLLIKKAVGERWCSIANSLNHSNLKTRITMMLRKRSSKWARAKALYVLPLTLLALGAFARTTYVLPEDKDTNNFQNEMPPSSPDSLRLSESVTRSNSGEVVSSSMTVLVEEKEDSLESVGQNIKRTYYVAVEREPSEEKSGRDSSNEISSEFVIVRGDTLSGDGSSRDILKQTLRVSDSVETIYDRDNHPFRYLKGSFRSVDGRNTYKVRGLKLQNLSGKKQDELPLVVADGRAVDITALTDELAGKIQTIRILSAEEAVKAGYRGARATNNGVIDVRTRNGEKQSAADSAVKTPRQTMRSQVTIQQDTLALDGRKMFMMYTSGNQQKMSITLTGDPETGVYSVADTAVVPDSRIKMLKAWEAGKNLDSISGDKGKRRKSFLKEDTVFFYTDSSGRMRTEIKLGRDLNDPKRSRTGLFARGPVTVVRDRNLEFPVEQTQIDSSALRNGENSPRRIEMETYRVDSSLLNRLNLEDRLLLLNKKEVAASFIQSLDPDQIKSIRVVKGQEMIDRYGARAANGVIFVSLRKERPAREQ